MPPPRGWPRTRSRLRIPPLVTSQELWAFAARNPVYSIAFVGLTAAIIANEVARLFRGYKALAPSQVTALINQENALVVDLRAAGDFQAGHIAGSKNVQMAQFDPENKQLAPARALPVVLVCQNGVTVNGAAKRLKKAGFERVHILEGGITAWRQADLPLVKGKA